MSQQLGIAYPPDYSGNQAWGRQIEALRAAVKHLGAKEVAFVLDVNGTHLSDALNERDRKVWHARWTHVVKAMLEARRGDETAAELLRAITEPDVDNTPYQLSEAVEITPEEEAAALRRELLRFGDAGKAAVDRVRRVPKARAR